MKCTHCNKELEFYKVSAEIPSRTEYHYILCQCGNVMIAKIVDNEIKHVEATPTDYTQRTIDMMNESRELFKKAGSNPLPGRLKSDSGSVKEKDGKFIIDKEEPVKEEPVTEEHCGECNNDAGSGSDTEEINNAIDSSKYTERENIEPDIDYDIESTEPQRLLFILIKQEVIHQAKLHDADITMNQVDSITNNIIESDPFLDNIRCSIVKQFEDRGSIHKKGILSRFFGKKK